MKKTTITVNTKTNVGEYENIDFSFSCEVDLSKNPEDKIAEFNSVFFNARDKFIKEHYARDVKPKPKIELAIMPVKGVLYD